MKPPLPTPISSTPFRHLLFFLSVTLALYAGEWVICNTCGGTGHVEKLCEDCGGDGMIQPVCQYCFGSGVNSGGGPCNHCNGTGYTDEGAVPCSTCGTTGSY